MGWIIHPIGVGDQRIEQRADFQKLMPIAAGARQSRHLDAEHETDIAKAGFGDEPLKAQAPLHAGPAHPPPAPSARVHLCASIIIPTRDRVDLLRRRIERLGGLGDKSDFEVIVVDNGSRKTTTRAYFAEITRD